MGTPAMATFSQVGLFLLLTIGAGCIADPLFADGELEDSWEHMDEMREISSLLETETDADLEKAPAKAAAHKAPAKAAAHKVTSFVPHFKSKKQVLKEQAKMKARYEKANKLYAKVSKKKYEAQGNKQKELNKKAEKAHQAMLKAKAAMMKKYAGDDPENTRDDHLTGKGPATGHYGSTGKWITNHDGNGGKGKLKWYDDGVTTAQASTVENGKNRGKYFLGRRRRRIGAGFGRRRRGTTDYGRKKKPETGPKAVKKAIKGHSVLKAGLKVKAAKPSTAKIVKAATKPVKPKKTFEAKKGSLSDTEKAALKNTGAGVDAGVDKTAHFTKKTDAKILGKKEEAALKKVTIGMEEWTPDMEQDLLTAKKYNDAFEAEAVVAELLEVPNDLVKRT